MGVTPNYGADQKSGLTLPAFLRTKPALKSDRNYPHVAFRADIWEFVKVNVSEASRKMSSGSGNKCGSNENIGFGKGGGSKARGNDRYRDLSQ